MGCIHDGLGTWDEGLSAGRGPCLVCKAPLSAAATIPLVALAFVTGYLIKTPIGRPNEPHDLTPAVPGHHSMRVRSPPRPLHLAIVSALRLLRPQFDGCRSLRRQFHRWDQEPAHAGCKVCRGRGP